MISARHSDGNNQTPLSVSQVLQINTRMWVFGLGGLWCFNLNLHSSEDGHYYFCAAVGVGQSEEVNKKWIRGGGREHEYLMANKSTDKEWWLGRVFCILLATTAVDSHARNSLQIIEPCQFNSLTPPAHGNTQSLSHMDDMRSCSNLQLCESSRTRRLGSSAIHPPARSTAVGAVTTRNFCHEQNRRRNCLH